MDIRDFKSNKKEGFIEKHRPEEHSLAAMAYALPLPNENFKQGGDFLIKKRLKNSYDKLVPITHPSTK